jgi:hypothetical protein
MNTEATTSMQNVLTVESVIVKAENVNVFLVMKAKHVLAPLVLMTAVDMDVVNLSKTCHGGALLVIGLRAL